MSQVLQACESRGLGLCSGCSVIGKSLRPPPVVARDSMSKKTPIRVGLVGAGYVSQFHIQALQRLANVQLVGIADMEESRARTVAEQFGLPASFPSLEAMCAERLDVVHVLTPPASHADVALEALKHGCDVLVEKPMATSVEDCDRIEQAGKAAGKTVCVNHSLLYDAFVVRALEIVRSGALGDVLTVDYLRSSDYPPYRGGPLPPQYREGGYPFRDLGVHALYLMQEFLGELRDVQAQFSTKGGDPNLLYDEWRALVRCKIGTGQIQLSWNVHPLQHVLIVQGTRGVVRADLFSMTVTVKKTTPLPKSLERASNAMAEGLQICWQVPANVLRFVRKKILPYHGLQMLIEEFYRRLESGEPAPVVPSQARPVVEWTEHIARQADASKQIFLRQFSKPPRAATLVTGAGGFIGRHLVSRLLEQGQPVRIFVRREPPLEWMENPRLDIILGDLGDPDAVERAVAGTGMIYHIGGAMKGEAHDFERGSVAGTRNVVESILRQQTPPRLVHLSSLSVLHAAIAKGTTPVTEDWPLEPTPEKRGVYTQTKEDAEKIVRKAVRENGLQAVILRPGRVFGPDTTLLTPDVARRVGKRLVILGNGELRLPLIYVEDVVDAILLAASRDVFDGSVFHLVDPAQITQNELTNEYIGTTGSDLKITHIPLAAVYGMAFGVELLGRLLGRRVPLSVYRVRSALAPLSFDCSAARDRLGWSPRTGVLVGLEKIIGRAPFQVVAGLEKAASRG